MKFLAAFAVGWFVCITCRMLSNQVLPFKIPEFLVGWLSCIGFYTTLIFSEYRKSKKRTSGKPMTHDEFLQILKSLKNK